VFGFGIPFQYQKDPLLIYLRLSRIFCIVIGCFHMLPFLNFEEFVENNVVCSKNLYWHLTVWHFVQQWRRKMAHELGVHRKQTFSRNSKHFRPSNQQMTNTCQWAGICTHAVGQALNPARPGPARPRKIRPPHPNYRPGREPDRAASERRLWSDGPNATSSVRVIRPPAPTLNPPAALLFALLPVTYVINY